MRAGVGRNAHSTTIRPVSPHVLFNRLSGRQDLRAPMYLFALRGKVFLNLHPGSPTEVPQELICPLKCSLLMSGEERLSYCASPPPFGNAQRLFGMSCGGRGDSFWGCAQFRNTVQTSNISSDWESVMVVVWDIIKQFSATCQSLLDQFLGGSLAVMYCSRFPFYTDIIGAPVCDADGRLSPLPKINHYEVISVRLKEKCDVCPAVLQIHYMTHSFPRGLWNQKVSPPGR